MLETRSNTIRVGTWEATILHHAGDRFSAIVAPVGNVGTNRIVGISRHASLRAAMRAANRALLSANRACPDSSTYSGWGKRLPL